MTFDKFGFPTSTKVTVVKLPGILNSGVNKRKSGVNKRKSGVNKPKPSVNKPKSPLPIPGLTPILSSPSLRIKPRKQTTPRKLSPTPRPPRSDFPPAWFPPSLPWPWSPLNPNPTFANPTSSSSSSSTQIPKFVDDSGDTELDFDPNDEFIGPDNSWFYRLLASSGNGSK